MPDPGPPEPDSADTPVPSYGIAINQVLEAAEAVVDSRIEGTSSVGINVLNKLSVAIEIMRHAREREPRNCTHPRQWRVFYPQSTFQTCGLCGAPVRETTPPESGVVSHPSKGDA